MVGNQIGALPNLFIEAIRNNMHDMEHPANFEYKLGQKVEIAKGPLAGFVAEVMQFDANQRVGCIFDLISGRVRISIDAANLISVT